MTIIARQECECCGGSRDYPILDKFGRERMRISCPVCFGEGMEEIEDEEEISLPPPSTAASIKTMEALRAHLQHERAREQREYDAAHSPRLELRF